MKTVKEVSNLTGVTVRTLQYYDKIGLFKASKYNKNGYRLYDDEKLKVLQQILLFKELDFSLNDIKSIINCSNFDKNKMLNDQIAILKLKKEHLENLINLAIGIKDLGVDIMDFKVFDTSKIDEYAKKVNKTWGNTAEYKEFEEKQKNRNSEDEKLLNVEMMNIFKKLGNLKERNPESEEVQHMISELKNFISKNFYKCINDTFLGLGKMYASG